MPRRLSNSKSEDFEPKKKNPLGLLDDSNLDRHLKSLKIGGKNAPIQLSDSEVRFDADFTLNGKFKSHSLETDNYYMDFKSAGYFRFYSDDITDAEAMLLGFSSGGDALFIIDQNLAFTANDDINFTATTGNINLLSSVNLTSGILKIAEQADAAADTAGYGQIWVDTATPNELAFTDDAGTDIIGIGKYHYETKFVGYYANATTSYLPMTGYVLEGTTSTSRNEYQGFCAPYNCTIEKITYRSEVAQDGNISFRVLEASDATEVPGTLVFRKETAVDIADDIYQELDMTSPTVGSDYAPLTKGKLYQFYLATPSAGYDTNITIVFKWDITS